LIFFADSGRRTQAMKRDGRRCGSASRGVLVPEALENGLDGVLWGPGVAGALFRGVERRMSSRWVMIPPIIAIPMVPVVC